MKRKHNPYIIALVLIDLSILAFTYFCSEVHEDGLTTLFYSGIVAGITCIILLLFRRKWAFIFYIHYEETGYSEGYCFGTYTKNDNEYILEVDTNHNCHKIPPQLIIRNDSIIDFKKGMKIKLKKTFF